MLGEHRSEHACDNFSELAWSPTIRLPAPALLDKELHVATSHVRAFIAATVSATVTGVPSLRSVSTSGGKFPGCYSDTGMKLLRKFRSLNPGERSLLLRTVFLVAFLRAALPAAIRPVEGLLGPSRQQIGHHRKNRSGQSQCSSGHEDRTAENPE